MYSIDEAAKLIIDCAHTLIDKGLIARTWGNISARISKKQFLITPSGMGYDRLTPDKLVVVNIDDLSYEGDIRPSSEKGIHANAYLLREDVNFVIHTHQPFATALSCKGEDVLVREDLRELLGEPIANAAYGISTTPPLAMRVKESIEKNPESNAILLRYHGVITLGHSCERAIDTAIKLEEYSRELVLENLTEEACDLSSIREDTITFSDGRKSALVKTNVVHYIAQINMTSPIYTIGGLITAVRPIIDDMAQIGGVIIRMIKENQLDNMPAILRKLKKNNVVFVKDVGAICVADNEEDLDALITVLEKNCLARLYAMSCGKNPRIGYFDARWQRNLYLEKYSKLK